MYFHEKFKNSHESDVKIFNFFASFSYDRSSGGRMLREENLCEYDSSVCDLFLGRLLYFFLVARFPGLKYFILTNTITYFYVKWNIFFEIRITKDLREFNLQWTNRRFFDQWLVFGLIYFWRLIFIRNDKQICCKTSRRHKNCIFKLDQMFNFMPATTKHSSAHFYFESFLFSALIQ